VKYLELQDVIELHSALISASGGSEGIRDVGLLESAVVQAQAAAFGQELYPTIAEKSAALLFSLAKNHAFVDGNKRIAQAAAERFLVENGFEIVASVNAQEGMVLAVASSEMSREELIVWLAEHIAPA
jgi:death-on-curing protein